MSGRDRIAAIEARLSAFLEAVPAGVSIESAAIFELTLAWQRIAALEAENAAIRANEGSVGTGISEIMEDAK